MPEYTSNAVQTVAANQNVIFTETPVRCTTGNVVHREGSGVATLRGITNQCRARYRVSFGANIAVPTGGTAGPISIALAISGEALPASTAIVTPAAVNEYFNVSVDTFVDVPRGCCVTVSVQNTSTAAINVQNTNMIITREA